MIPEAWNTITQSESKQEEAETWLENHNIRAELRTDLNRLLVGFHFYFFRGDTYGYRLERVYVARITQNWNVSYKVGHDGKWEYKSLKTFVREHFHTLQDIRQYYTKWLEREKRRSAHQILETQAYAEEIQNLIKKPILPDLEERLK